MFLLQILYGDYFSTGSSSTAEHSLKVCQSRTNELEKGCRIVEFYKEEKKTITKVQKYQSGLVEHGSMPLPCVKVLNSSTMKRESACLTTLEYQVVQIENVPKY